MAFKFDNPLDGMNTEYYADLLKEDSKPKRSIIQEDDIEDAEIIEEYMSVLEANTTRGLPPIPQGLQELDTGKTEASEQISKMFSKLFNDLNSKYGLDVKLDFDSFSKSLEYTIQPKNKVALELYLSEAYGRFRVTLYGMYLNAVSLLSAQILDPSYILSNSMPYEGKLLVLKQLFEFMTSLNEIYKEVNIEDTDLKLQKLSETDQLEADMTDPNVMEFLRLLTENVKSNEDNKHGRIDKE